MFSEYFTIKALGFLDSSLTQAKLSQKAKDIPVSAYLGQSPAADQFSLVSISCFQGFCREIIYFFYWIYRHF